jgi:hypothetical protein
VQVSDNSIARNRFVGHGLDFHTTAEAVSRNSDAASLRRPECAKKNTVYVTMTSRTNPGAAVPSQFPNIVAAD